MIWGETGTRQGATKYQVASVAWLWAKYGIFRLHNGDCIGVDEQLFHLASAFRIPVTLHPPSISKYRAFCDKWDVGAQLMPEKGYHERDENIVKAAEVMVSIQLKPFEMTRGGTKHTTDYTRNQAKPLALIWPNGRISYERWDLKAL